MLSQIFALASSTTTDTDVVALVIGIALMVMAVFLVIAVLMQSGKDKGLSGSISGASDTFFSKSKSATWDKILGRLTFIIAIIFAILVVVMYLYVSK